MNFPLKFGGKHVSFRVLLYFFIPLGFSASLVNVSHVIVNSTLARAPDAAAVIASYAVAKSLFEVLERCAVILRQTSSTLVRDKISFKAMSQVTLYVLGTLLAIGLMISYLPPGKWIFSMIMGVKESLLKPTLNAYRILLFVTMFSGMRSLFQGVIISNLKTSWMTIGMVIRFVFMILISWAVVAYGWITHGYVGAIIYLTGVIIEASISAWKGGSLIKQLPEKKEGHSVVKQSQIFQFYRPFLFASLMAVSIKPSINIALGLGVDPEIAIAAYAVAFSVMELFISFTRYVHQIVIHFYDEDSQAVTGFIFMLSLIPALMLTCLAFSSVGIWCLHQIIGVSGELMDETLVSLRVFILFSLVFPWLNYVNGILLLKRQTKIMKVSKMGNVVMTGISLILMIGLFSDARGAIGALAQSMGLLVEFCIALLVLNHLRREKTNRILG